jgi:hypothetical protein
LRTIIVLALLSIGMLAGCSTDQTPGTYTYDNVNLGVSATLPGSAWSETNPTLPGGVQGSAAVAVDHTMFLVMRKDVVVSSSSDLKVLVDKAATGYGLQEPYSYTSEIFHGYQAARVEASTSNSGASPDQRFTLYGLSAKSHFYVIAAGCDVSKWDAGGKEMLQAILDSVQIR